MKTTGLISSLALALCLAPPAHGGLPEPDNVVYGSITIGLDAITAARTDVVVQARRSLAGPVLSSYRMGAIPSAGNYYSLRIPVESAPVGNPAAAETGATLYLVVRDATGDRESKPFVVGARGVMTRLDFGNTDSDHNGLGDDWERQYFGAIGQNPNADPDQDGQTNSQEWLAATNPLVADARHPADNNPINNLITIGEVTAYGLAWKTGKSWPVSPTDIPIDYVTRAGALWKGGELYKLDTNAAASAPLWWVNVTQAVSGLSLTGSAGKVHSLALKASPALQTPALSRSAAPHTKTPNSLSVRIAATPAGSGSVYAVEERVSPGVILSGISDDGALDSGGRKIRWGPFFDARSRILSYNARADGEQARFLSFQGSGSFDGASIPTAGSAMLSLAGQSAFVEFAVDQGVFKSTLVATPLTKYRVEFSQDLQAWELLLEVQTDETGGVTFSDLGAGQSMRFYRVRTE